MSLAVSISLVCVSVLKQVLKWSLSLVAISFVLVAVSRPCHLSECIITLTAPL